MVQQAKWCLGGVFFSFLLPDAQLHTQAACSGVGDEGKSAREDSQGQPPSGGGRQPPLAPAQRRRRPAAARAQTSCLRQGVGVQGVEVELRGGRRDNRVKCRPETVLPPNPLILDVELRAVPGRFRLTSPGSSRCCSRLSRGPLPVTMACSRGNGTDDQC